MLRLDAKIESKETPAKNTDEIIQQICELAKSKNKEALSKLMSEILCIDITNGKTTAVEILAVENDVESVRFLIEEFHANKDNALRGAAAGGHLELMHSLLAKGADIDYAAIGAGMGGDYKLARKMVDLGAELLCVAFGAGAGNQLDVLKKLFQQEADLDEDLLKEAIYGAALGGCLELMEDLLPKKSFPNIEKKNVFILFALCNAILGGNSKIIDTLIMIGSSEIITSFIGIQFIIFAAAQGGHHNLMEKYIIKGDMSHVNSAALGSTVGGHFDQIEDMILQGATNLDAMLAVAIVFDHQSLVKYLISKGAKYDEAASYAFRSGKCELAANLIMKEAKIGTFTHQIKEHADEKDDVLRLLTALSEPWRSQLATEMKTSIPEIQFNIKALSAKATKIDILMRQRGLSYRQALVWESSEIQGYLAYYSSIKHLSPDSSFIIASYITDSLITKKDFEDLFHKMSLDIRKINLNYDLESCYRSSGLFAPFKNRRPKQLASICKEAKSEKELDLLLAKENLLLTQSKESPYKTLIRSHIKQIKDKKEPEQISNNHLILR